MGLSTVPEASKSVKRTTRWTPVSGSTPTSHTEEAPLQDVEVPIIAPL